MAGFLRRMRSGRPGLHNSGELPDREALKERLLKSYSVYYNVSVMGIREPFFAEAEFHEKNDHYFLVRSARLSESDSNEYVYFAQTGCLGTDELSAMCEEAFRRGLFMCRPHSGHRNTDVLLYVLADSIPEETVRQIGGIRMYRSYKHTFWGWSKFRLVAIDVSKGEAFYNREGRLLEAVVCNIMYGERS